MSEPNIQLETVNVSVAEATATIELSRPQALNAWNAQLGADLLADRLEGEGLRSLISLTLATIARDSEAAERDAKGVEGNADHAAPVCRAR